MTLEFILVFPILWISFLATFEYGIWVLVNEAVVSSSIEGARKAAEFGADVNTIARTVQTFLNVHCIEFSTTGSGSGSNSYGDALVVIQFGPITLDGHFPNMEYSNQTFYRGNTDIPCTATGPGHPPPGNNQVLITVCTPVTNASGCRPVPNWIDTYGIDISSYTFQACSLANLE